MKLEQILVTNNYTKEDLLIANCPTPEQISFLLSSVNVGGSTIPPTSEATSVTTSGSDSVLQ